MSSFADMINESDEVPEKKTRTKKREIIDDDPPVVPKKKEVIKMSSEEFAECKMIRSKIQRANELFPEKSIVNDKRFNHMDKMTLLELREFYDDVYKSCASSSEKFKIWTQVYQQTSIISEKIVSSYYADVRGATEYNMQNPEIQRCLNLIEIEYGLEQYGFKPNPLQSLLLSTVVGFSTFAQLKKNQAQASSQATDQPPPEKKESIFEAEKLLAKVKKEKEIEK